MIKIEMKNCNYLEGIKVNMYHPTGFSDSENIIIVDNMPYYKYTGSTYKDRLKNGLSLDYVFQMEDMIPIMNDESIEEIESKEARINLKFIDYEENYEFNEQKEFQTIRMKRKGNWIPLKKRQARNKKKNSIRINGYSDKLFAIEQNLPELSHETQSEIHCELIYHDSLYHFCGINCSSCRYFINGYDSYDELEI